MVTRVDIGRNGRTKMIAPTMAKMVAMQENKIQVSHQKTSELEIAEVQYSTVMFLYRLKNSRPCHPFRKE
jgi:hypothetical protein